MEPDPTWIFQLATAVLRVLALLAIVLGVLRLVGDSSLSAAARPWLSAAALLWASGGAADIRQRSADLVAVDIGGSRSLVHRASLGSDLHPVVGRALAARDPSVDPLSIDCLAALARDDEENRPVVVLVAAEDEPTAPIRMTLDAARWLVGAPPSLHGATARLLAPAACLGGDDEVRSRRGSTPPTAG